MIEQLTAYLFSLPGGPASAALALLIVFAAALYISYWAVFFAFGRLSARTKTDFDDMLLARMRAPAKLFVAFTSIFLSLSITYPDLQVAGAGPSSLYAVSLMIVGAFALDRLVSASLGWYKKEIAPKTGSKMDDEMVPIIEKVLRALIYVVALMMVLGNLGIEITPLLAGLGIASLAVALALQDSLGNFFAGVNIAVDRPLRKDDLVSTDFGVEGVVQEIGWRSTKILTPQNNLVIVPNTKLAQSVITNYHRPDEAVRMAGTVGVSYSADPDAVAEAIRRAIRKAAEKSESVEPSYVPIARLDSFGDFSLNFKFVFSAKNYGARLSAADEVNRAVLREFRAEGIEIPFPVRTVYSVPQEKEEKKKRK